MKNALIISLLSIPFHAATSQHHPSPTDRQLVQNTIQLYFDGWATGDTSKISRAMHYSCHLKNFREGLFYDIDKAKYLSFHNPHTRDQNLLTQVVSLDITDGIAGAKTEISTDKEIFTDYLNLMKTSEGWLIVDKVSVRKPRITTENSAVKAEKKVIIDGLKRPWSMAFLTEDEVLITEKEGGLLRANLANKQKVRIKGFANDVADSIGARNSGDNSGIFEILLDPDFNKNKFVYISYAAQNKKGTTTKVIRGVLHNDYLSQVQTLFVAAPYTRELFHYGGGMVFGADGKLYLTVGERLYNESDEPAIPIAQNIEDERGKIYRINSDGSIPEGNPDFGKNSVPGLYALGIRAAQGITVEPDTKKIWFSEHGTLQGDEINILNPHANYGWPVKTTGKYRSATYIPPANDREHYTDPVWFWLQTVAPTGLLFYTGDEFPLWKKNLFVSGLFRGSLWRFTVAGETIKSAEELFVDDRVRLRKVIQSPGGKLYILTDELNGKVIRIINSSIK